MCILKLWTALTQSREQIAYQKLDTQRHRVTLDTSHCPRERAPLGLAGERWGALRSALQLPLGGGIVELSGPPSSGKSSLSLALAASLTRRGELAVYLDLEGSLCPHQAALFGVDLSALLPLKPRSGEEALEMIERLIERRASPLIILDSLDALTPLLDLEGPLSLCEERREALIAATIPRLASLALRAQIVLLITRHAGAAPLSRGYRRARLELPPGGPRHSAEGGGSPQLIFSPKQYPLNGEPQLLRCAVRLFMQDFDQ